MLSGGNYGSWSIDAAFKTHIESLVGQEAFARLKDKAKIRMMEDFKYTVKKSFSGNGEPSFVSLLGVNDNPSKGIEDGEIKVER